jgi:hypothetical protein
METMYICEAFTIRDNTLQATGYGDTPAIARRRAESAAKYVQEFGGGLVCRYRAPVVAI